MYLRDVTYVCGKNILFRPNLATLNRRNELVSTCRHANKFLLKMLNLNLDYGYTCI